MLFRRRIAPNVFMIIGLVALVLADTCRLIVRHSGHPASNLADGVTGLFFGIAIASLLVWVVKGKRRSA